MMIKTLHDNGTSYPYISISGKLWVNASPYDFDIDEMLNDNERLYMHFGTIEYYGYIQHKRQVFIYYPNFINSMNPKTAIDALREVAKCILKKFPGAKKIIFDGTMIYFSNDGTNFKTSILSGIKYKGRNNRQEVIVVCPSNKNKAHKYKQVTDIKIHTEHKSKPKVFVFNDYSIVLTKNKIIFVQTKSLLDEKMAANVYNATNLKRSIKSSKTPSRIKNTKYGVKIFSNKDIILYSPKDVPTNSFLISHNSEYIQFTRDGIIITNGIFFAKEPLEEVKKPWYIVEKTEDGWDIYIFGEDDFNGYYKIIGDELYTLLNGQLVLFGTKPSHEASNREEVVIGEKRVYVPKPFIEELFAMQL